MNDFIHLIQEWRRLQPLSSAQDQALWRQLRLQWNYHSNHIEGNTLTYGETEMLLIQGRTMGLTHCDRPSLARLTSPRKRDSAPRR